MYGHMSVQQLDDERQVIGMKIREVPLKANLLATFVHWLLLRHYGRQLDGIGAELARRVPRKA